MIALYELWFGPAGLRSSERSLVAIVLFRVVGANNPARSLQTGIAGDLARRRVALDRLDGVAGHLLDERDVVVAESHQVPGLRGGARPALIAVRSLCCPLVDLRHSSGAAGGRDAAHHERCRREDRAPRLPNHPELALEVVELGAAIPAHAL